jgi:hypothetical protein
MYGTFSLITRTPLSRTVEVIMSQSIPFFSDFSSGFEKNRSKESVAAAIPFC